MQSRQSLAKTILHDLSALGGAHRDAYANLAACINTINAAQRRYEQDAVYTNAKDPHLYILQMQLEQNAAFALLALFKEPTPRTSLSSRMGLLAPKRNDAAQIKNKVIEITQSYFVEAGSRTKPTDEQIVSALVKKIELSQHLIHLLKDSDTSSKIMPLFEAVNFWQANADIRIDKDMWRTYNSQLEKYESFTASQPSDFVIKECYMDPGLLAETREHHFDAQMEPASLEPIIIPALGLLIVGIAGTRGSTLPTSEAVNIFSSALEDALILKKNSENIVWETNAPVRKENVAKVKDVDSGRTLLNESFDSKYKEAFSLGIERGIKKSAAVLHVYFIDANQDPKNPVLDQVNESSKVFAFSFEQAQKFAEFVANHPLWFDRDEGWRLQRYLDFLPLKERVINLLCDKLDELSQSFSPGVQSCLMQEIAHFRSQQAAAITAVCIAFDESKKFCERVVQIDLPMGKQPLAICLVKSDSQLTWMRDVAAKAREDLLHKDSGFLQDQAAMAIREYQPGLLGKRLGDEQPTKTSVDAAYIACLKDYLNDSPKSEAVFKEIQKEYLFLSNPLIRQALSEKPQNTKPAVTKTEHELTEFNEAKTTNLFKK